MNITTMTPREVDTRLAALNLEWERAKAIADRAGEGVRYVVGQKPKYVTRTRKQWPTSLEDAIAQARQLPAGRDRNRGYLDPAEIVATLDAAYAAVAAIEAQIEPLEAEYRKRRWSRFFLVLNSNGHIHQDRNCSTCHPTTRYRWLPELSGLDDAAAVADQGPLLCSVCYPSAPTEWTTGKVKPAGCPGSGKAPKPDTVRRTGMTYRGRCTECNDGQAVTTSGVIRKHNPPKAKK